MKKNLKIGLILAIVVVLLLALTSTALAGKREMFSLKFEVPEFGFGVNYYGEGTYVLTQPFEDSGTVFVHWRPYDGVGSAKGTMAFQSDQGYFVARLDGDIIAIEDNCGTIKFNIIENRGTGLYEDLKGNGEAGLCNDDPKLYGWFEGTAILPSDSSE